jgi:hypothetical protein
MNNDENKAIQNIVEENAVVEDECEDEDYLKDNLIDIDTSTLNKCKFNNKYFQKGIDDISEVCGKISALVNVGINPVVALQFISGIEDYKTAIKINEMNTKTAVETAKYVDSNIQKQSL